MLNNTPVSILGGHPGTGKTRLVKAAIGHNLGEATDPNAPIEHVLGGKPMPGYFGQVLVIDSAGAYRGFTQFAGEQESARVLEVLPGDALGTTAEGIVEAARQNAPVVVLDLSALNATRPMAGMAALLHRSILAFITSKTAPNLVVADDACQVLLPNLSGYDLHEALLGIGGRYIAERRHRLCYVSSTPELLEGLSDWEIVEPLSITHTLEPLCAAV